MGDALLTIFGLYVLLMFAGAVPPPTFFIIAWIQERERRHERQMRGKP